MILIGKKTYLVVMMLSPHRQIHGITDLSNSKQIAYSHLIGCQCDRYKHTLVSVTH